MLNQAQFIDQLEQRLLNAQKHIMHVYQSRVQTQTSRLLQTNPQPKITQAQNQVSYLHKQLIHQIHDQLNNCRHQLNQKSTALDTVSPLATLQRGYAIVTDEQGNVVRNAQEVEPDSRIKARVHQGKLLCKVLESESC